MQLAGTMVLNTHSADPCASTIHFKAELVDAWQHAMAPFILHVISRVSYTKDTVGNKRHYHVVVQQDGVQSTRWDPLGK